MTPVTRHNDDGDDIERKLYAVTTRLEHATNDLQSLVNQLRASFAESTTELERGERERAQREHESAYPEYISQEVGVSGPTGPSGA